MQQSLKVEFYINIVGEGWFSLKLCPYRQRTKPFAFDKCCFYPGLIPKCILTTPKHMHLHRLTTAPRHRVCSIVTLEGRERGHLCGNSGAASVASIWWPSFCFPSLIFMLRRAFALVPWNIDAVWKEERRPTIHCHMRIDRKKLMMGVLKSELKGKYSQSLYQPVLLHSHLPSEFKSLLGT